VNAIAPCTADDVSTVTVSEQQAPNAGTDGTLTVCQGTAPTNADLFNSLSGTPDTGGTWSIVGLVYTYTVAATAPCTSDAAATVTVTEQAQPNAGSNGTLDICQGTTVTEAELFSALSGTPDAGGTWSPALAGAGTYTYTVNAIAPCTGSSSASVTVSEQQAPNAGTDGTLTVCAGTAPTNADLFNSLSGTPDTGGTWSNVGLAYTYTVAATAPCTLDATATVTVTEQAQPNAGSNGTLDICQGSTVTTAELFAVLGGTPDAGGTWSPALAGAGTYTYTVTAIAPCATDATTQVVVTEITAPDAGTDGTLTICQGSTVTAAELFASLGGTPDAGGTWSPALVGVGTYTYTATVAGCSDATASVTVTEQVQPNAGTSGTLTVCEGTVPTNADLFAALSGTPDAGGTWSNVGLAYTYTVAATAPCTSDATATVTVIEQAQPNAGSNGMLDICQGTTVTAVDLFSSLIGTPDAGGTWTPALPGAGTYTYTVTATAPCSSDATALVELIISPCDIIIPTGFTPNGDNANDEWEILGLDEQYIENQVFVYNRWGNLLYASKKGSYSTSKWDGTFENKPLPVGSYYYLIYTDPSNEGNILKGIVSIIKK
jgi:gliding motility-associated-like protein